MLKQALESGVDLASLNLHQEVGAYMARPGLRDLLRSCTFDMMCELLREGGLAEDLANIQVDTCAWA
jgi:hypothetical protein